MTPIVHTFTLSITHTFCIACQCVEVLPNILIILFSVPLVTISLAFISPPVLDPSTASVLETPESAADLNDGRKV